MSFREWTSYSVDAPISHSCWIIVIFISSVYFICSTYLKSSLVGVHTKLLLALLFLRLYYFTIFIFFISLTLWIQVSLILLSHLVRTDLLVSTRSTYTSTSIHFMWSSWLFSNLYKELPQTSRCIYASWRSLVCRQLSTFDFGAHFQPAHFFSCTFISIVELAQVVNFVKLLHFEKFQWISRQRMCQTYISV